MTESSVSISTTSAIVYSLSGLVFFLLAVILVMMGVTNCNWDCCERYFCNILLKTRSLGALPAPTSSWRPFGPLDFVIRALRALRPCDPPVGDWIVC